MENKSKRKAKMSTIGIGFKMALSTIIYSFIIVKVSFYSRIDFKINAVPDNLLIILGTVLIIMKSQISIVLKQELNSARVYAEGRGIRIEVKDETFINDIKELINIKIAN
jgi:hypothetical protein